MKFLLDTNAERFRARRRGRDGAAPSGSAAAAGHFRDHDTISVLAFEREDPRVAAQLRASLNSQGPPMGAYDLLIAVCALRRGLKIVTHNAREFIRVGGLGLEDWHGR